MGVATGMKLWIATCEGGDGRYVIGVYETLTLAEVAIKLCKWGPGEYYDIEEAELNVRCL